MMGMHLSESPGELAGATGAGSTELAFKSEDYRNRARAATTLCHAIAECDPADACEIMAAALADLTMGAPIPALFGVMDEAAFWADMANRRELKAYALACYNRLSVPDRRAFLGYVRGAAA